MGWPSICKQHLQLEQFPKWKGLKMEQKTDMTDAIADCLLEDHMALMTENAELRHKADRLNDAMLMLAKLRDEKNYPKGGYSSDVTSEWDTILDSWFGEVRPCF